MRLKETFESNLVIDSLIRGKALSMAREFSSKRFDNFCSETDLPDGSETDLPDGSETIDLGLWDELEGNLLDQSEEAVTLREHYSAIIRFLSLFAQVCRMESRQPGTIGAFLDSFENIPGLNVKECKESLAFLLYA